MKTQFQTLEAQCDLTYPLCGCAAGQPTADDGSRLRFTDQAGVTCLQGKCTTFVPDCGQPCGAGTTCFSCISKPTMFAACTTMCADSNACSRSDASALPDGHVGKHVGQVLHGCQRRMRHQVKTSAHRSAILLGWIVLLAAGCNSSGASSDATGAAGAGGNTGSGGAGGSGGASGGGGSAGGQGSAEARVPRRRRWAVAVRRRGAVRLETEEPRGAGMDGGAGGRGWLRAATAPVAATVACRGGQVCYVDSNLAAPRPSRDRADCPCARSQREHDRLDENAHPFDGNPVSRHSVSSCGSSHSNGSDAGTGTGGEGRNDRCRWTSGRERRWAWRRQHRIRWSVGRVRRDVPAGHVLQRVR